MVDCVPWQSGLQLSQLREGGRENNVQRLKGGQGRDRIEGMGREEERGGEGRQDKKETGWGEETER